MFEIIPHHNYGFWSSISTHCNSAVVTVQVLLLGDHACTRAMYGFPVFAHTPTVIPQFKGASAVLRLPLLLVSMPSGLDIPVQLRTNTAADVYRKSRSSTLKSYSVIRQLETAHIHLLNTRGLL